jgi:hypothetical protein
MGFTADEPVEIVEPHAGRPAVEGTGDTALPVRRVVVLAEPGSRVAVALKDCTHGRGALRDHVVVAGEARCPFRKKADAAIMVVASGDQRRARRSADGRGVEAVVAQPVGGELVESGCRHRSTKCAHLTEADVIQENDNDIR